MTCKNCKIAKGYNAYPLFCPSCLACGVRLIQLLGQLPIPVSECVSRRRAALAVWVNWGHNEAQIRELVKGPMCIGPLHPHTATGPDVAMVSEPHRSVKYPSRGKKLSTVSTMG
jgi:hypothetical protein